MDVSNWLRLFIKNFMLSIALISSIKTFRCCNSLHLSIALLAVVLFTERQSESRCNGLLGGVIVHIIITRILKQTFALNGQHLDFFQLRLLMDGAYYR